MNSSCPLIRRDLLSEGGKYLRLGLPGFEATPTDSGGDWMIEVMLAK